MPDGTGHNTSHPNWPDFSFRADGDLVFRTFGIMPGEQGTFAHSPASGPNHNELAPQFLGTSGTWHFPNGVTQLEFIDWPRTIGIDNLVLGVGIQQIPEPASGLLLGAGLVGLCWARTKRRHGTRAGESG
jgi:hypothetical protein